MAQGAAADRHVQRQLQKIATCHASSSQGGGSQFAGVHELISGTMNAMDVSAPALCASGDWYLSVDDCAAPKSHDARRHADLVGSAGLEGNSSSPLARHGSCPWILRACGKVSDGTCVPAEFTWRPGARIAGITSTRKEHQNLHTLCRVSSTYLSQAMAALPVAENSAFPPPQASSQRSRSRFGAQCPAANFHHGLCSIVKVSWG
jgi:hypothetical protein